MINVTVEFIGIVICILGIVQTLINARFNRNAEKYFVAVFVSLIIFSVSNIVGQHMRGLVGNGWRAALVVSNFVEFCMPCVIIYLLVNYVLSEFDAERERKGIRILIKVLLLLHIVLLLISQFTGLYYTIDSENIYRRSALYPLSYIFTAVMMLLYAYLLIVYRKSMTLHAGIAFWISFTVPCVAMIAQIFIYGIYLIVFSSEISSLAMYMFLMSDYTNRYYRQQQEITKLKIDIMLAQIQPHFMYNCLQVIQHICLTDPEKASEAIGDFSDYLRHQTDSILNDRPIPFEEELNHVSEYIKLQKLRFSDDLDISFELYCSDFDIPTMTLQPLVENAVIYGVRRSDTGKGTVTIRSEEFPDRYEISVIDNGSGFNADKVSDTGQRVGTGIQNVRNRLRLTCGGDLKIVSQPGKGTTATIILPKGGEKC